MTFAIVLANADNLIQVSDRRLTSQGRLIDDSSNKVGHGICDDMSFLYCYTGISRIDTNKATSAWLLEALAEATSAGHKAWDIVERFAENASARFRASRFLSRLSGENRRLTIMLTGYTRDAHIASFLVSNFQDFANSVDHDQAQPEFTVYAERSTESLEHNPTLIQAIGCFSALRDHDVLPLRQMLVERRGHETIRQSAVSLVRSISERPIAQGTVGKKLNTARLSSRHPFIPFAGYETDEAENVIAMLDVVDVRSESPLIQISDITLTGGDAVVFPRAHRNAPCPCGSGRAFRNCHRIKGGRSS